MNILILRKYYMDTTKLYKPIVLYNVTNSQLFYNNTLWNAGLDNPAILACRRFLLQTEGFCIGLCLSSPWIFKFWKSINSIKSYVHFPNKISVSKKNYLKNENSCFKNENYCLKKYIFLKWSPFIIDICFDVIFL